MTGSALSRLSNCKSTVGTASIRVLSLSALLLVSLSMSAELTEARLLSVPTLLGARTSICTVLLAPEAKVPVNAQLIVLAPVQVQPVPLEAISCIPDGKVSVKTKPAPAPGCCAGCIAGSRSAAATARNGRVCSARFAR